MTWYVHRRDGAIASAHQEQQRGYADEALADDDAELVVFLEAPKIAAKARQDARVAALADGSGGVTRAELNALKAVLREQFGIRE